MTDEASGKTSPLSKVKEAMAKATHAVTNLVKKDDDGAGGKPDIDHSTTDNAKKMKDAVKEARKNKDDD